MLEITRRDKLVLKSLARTTRWPYSEIEKCYNRLPNIESVRFTCMLADESNMTPLELLMFSTDQKEK